MNNDTLNRMQTTLDLLQPDDRLEALEYYNDKHGLGLTPQDMDSILYFDTDTDIDTELQELNMQK